MYGKQYGYDSGTIIEPYGSNPVPGVYTGGEVSYCEKTSASEGDESDGNQGAESESYRWSAGKSHCEYTAESGVRGLKKQIDVLCRHAAVKLVKGEQKSITVNEKRVQEFLGQGIIHDTILKHPQPGVMTGLAWTSAGGEILFIETSFTKGSGKIIITGQLGDVMKESAQIAITLVKKRYPDKADLFKENDLHIHVPSGAVPKDGPSAGITLVTALTSLVTDTPINPEYAMTGEVSLRGGVMPIGGLPEKLMAAQRAGIKKVLIPAENERDLEEVAEEVKEKLEIVPVETVEQVMKLVFA